METLPPRQTRLARLTVPQHIAIIMDGNRRWAKAHRLGALRGHRKGMRTAEDIVLHAFARGIPYVTIFAFSTENWDRDKGAVEDLFNLFRQGFKSRLKELAEKGVRIKFIGNLQQLPADILRLTGTIEEESEEGTRGTVIIALNYGGHDEIIRAVQGLIRSQVKAHDVTPELFSSQLDTRDIPDPDIIIRTGDVNRLSNFLPWQMSYSQVYFSEKMWPDFTSEDLDRILEDFAETPRRFGA